MSISEKIKNYYSNCIENIKLMKNKNEKKNALKALINDLGNKGTSIIAKILGMAYKTVKNYVSQVLENSIKKK